MSIETYSRYLSVYEFIIHTYIGKQVLNLNIIIIYFNIYRYVLNNPIMRINIYVHPSIIHFHIIILHAYILCTFSISTCTMLSTEM